VDADRPVFVEIKRRRRQCPVDDDIREGASSCGACGAGTSGPAAAKHPEELIDRVILEGVSVSPRGWREIRWALLVGLEPCPAIRDHIVLPGITLCLRRTTAEKDGATVDGIKGRSDPASRSLSGICSLSPGGGPVLALRWRCRQKE